MARLLNIAAVSTAVIVTCILLHQCGFREGSGHTEQPAVNRTTSETAPTPTPRAGGPSTGDDAPPDSAGDEVQPQEHQQPAERRPDVDDLSPEERAAEREAFFQRGIDAFEREPVDSAWAADAASRFEASLSARGVQQRFPQVRFGQVECRSRTCALALQVDDASRFGPLDRTMRAVIIDLVRQGIKFDMSRAATLDPSGSGILVRYHFTSTRSEP
jgi:hypothetical protein